MADCARECFRIISKWESYTLEKPYKEHFIPMPNSLPCSRLTDQEAEDHVADEVRNHNENHSVEEPGCPEGCQCVKYETAAAPRFLQRRIEKRSIGWAPSPNCVYIVDFTVSIREIVIPIGFCRPDKPPRAQVHLPFPVDDPLRPKTLPGDIAPPR